MYMSILKNYVFFFFFFHLIYNIKCKPSCEGFQKLTRGSNNPLDVNKLHSNCIWVRHLSIGRDLIWISISPLKRTKEKRILMKIFGSLYAFH